MQALQRPRLAPQLAATPGRGPAARRACTVRAQSSSFPGVPIDPKLEKELLRSPYDFLAFGPRVVLAAALSLNDTTQTIQSNVVKLQELAQDPRPIDVKVQDFSVEVQGQLADYAQRGRSAEADLLKNAAAVLPEQVRSLIPVPMGAEAGADAPVTTVVVGEEDDEQMDEPYDPEQFYGSKPVLASRAAAELSDLQLAVEAMQAALSALASNDDPSKAAMLKINAREARGGLARRLAQLSPNTIMSEESADVPVKEAVEEAQKLLEEVDALSI